MSIILVWSVSTSFLKNICNKNYPAYIYLESFDSGFESHITCKNNIDKQILNLKSLNPYSLRGGGVVSTVLCTYFFQYL